MPPFLIMATPIKQAQDKALIFDLRQFAALGEEENYLLCLNENTYFIVLSLFSFYGYWLNRYTPDKDGEIWYKAEGSDAVFVGDMFDKGMEELMSTTCVTDLVDAINNGFASIATALGALQLNCAPQITVQPPNLNFLQEVLQDMGTTVNVNSGCGCGCGSSGSGGGSGGSGDIPTDYGYPDPFNPTPLVPTSPGGSFPATFANNDQWQNFRCRYATAILKGAVAVANSWWKTDVMLSVLQIAFAGEGFSAAVAFLAASLGATEYGVLALSTTSVTAIALPLILAAGAIIVTLNAVALNDIANILLAAKDGIICAMLAQSNPADARQSFLAAIATILDENNVPLDGILLNPAYGLLFPDKVFSRMFYDSRPEVGTLPLATCPCLTDEGQDLHCFTFDTDDLSGFMAVSATGLLTCSHVLTTFSFMQVIIASPGLVDPATDRIWSPELNPYTILDGDHLVLCGDSGVHGLWFYATIDGVDTLINTPGTFTGSYTYDIDLTPYAGQVLTNFSWLINKAGGGTFKFYFAGLNCTCEL